MAEDLTVPSLPSVKSPPMGMMANARNAGTIDRYGRQDGTPGDRPAVGEQVLLEEELDAVGEGLEDAPRARPGWGRCGSACRR